MSRPELEPLDQELAALVSQHGVAGDPMPDATRGRLRNRLALAMTGAIGPEAPTDALPTPPPTAPGATAGAGALGAKAWLLCAAALVVGGAAGAGLHAGLADGEPPAAVVPAAPDAARPPPPDAGPDATAAPDADTTAAPDAGRPAPVRRRGSPRRARAKASQPHRALETGARPDEPLARERALIEIARTALARSDSAAALRNVRRHARQFPAGRLAEERESLWIQALVSRGARAEARERGRRFIERYPQSLLLPVVRRSLSSIP